MSDETSHSEEVIVPKERNIPVSKDHFLSLLLSKFEVEKSKQHFGELCSMIETLFYVNRVAKIEGFKKYYSCFARFIGEFKHELPLEELRFRQNHLMDMIFSILKDGHFNAITFEMYKNSIEQVFLSDLPIKVDWGKLDSLLFTEFYEKYPSQNPYKDLKLKPPFYQHFAMFYRGYGLHTLSGLFMAPKLNLILADLMPMFKSRVARFIPFAYSKLIEKLSKSDLWHDYFVYHSPKNDEKNDIEMEKLIEIDTSMLKLERVSLLDTYNTAKAKGWGATLEWFLNNIVLKEPTFKRLMLIHRPITESWSAEQTRKWKDKAFKLKSKLSKTAQKKLGLKHQKSEESKEESVFLVDEIGRKRKSSLFQLPEVDKVSAREESYALPIRIQYFSDIPMSDLEVTYPAKKFSLKPMDNVYLTFTISIGVWAIIQEMIFSTDTMIGYWMVMLAVFLMIRSIIWYRATESEYVRVLNQALVESNISSDQDTILSLIDSVDEQEFMETILAYFVLLTNKNEVITDSDGVDRLCERFVRNEFGQDVNVMIDGAMRKLGELGLFVSGNDESIGVKGLLDALSCAHSHYQSAIQTVRKITVNSVKIESENDEKKSDLYETVEDETVEDETVEDEIVEDETVKDETVKDAKSQKGTAPPIISDQEISSDHFGPSMGFFI